MATNTAGMTPDQMRDPNHFPGFIKGIPLGIQHILAMFVSNVTPAVIIAGAAGFGFGSPDIGPMIYMIQMSMVFAGIATLLQTVSVGPFGARLPIVQGTSFAFLPVMIPIVAGKGVDAMAILMGGIVAGGIFHFFLGTFIGRIRNWLPPLVTGLIVLMIGLALISVGIKYAAGGAADFQMAADDFGGLKNWTMAGTVILVTLILKFFTKGMLSVAAVLIGLIAGYVVAYFMGEVNFGNIAKAGDYMIPNPMHFGLQFSIAAVVGMCLMSIISAIETVGDVSGITKGGAGREATDREISGATYADGIGTAVAGVFGGLPNTSFSQNVGLVAMTGIMSRHVVTLGALFLIACGFFPKVGAAISTIPIEVLGGGVIVMFGMVAAAGVSLLADVNWTRRNLVIFAIALSVGLGLQLVPTAMQHLPDQAKILMTSGLLPAAFIAILLNALMPEDEENAASAHLRSGHGGSEGGDDAGYAKADYAKADYGRADYDTPHRSDVDGDYQDRQYRDAPRHDDEYDRPHRDVQYDDGYDRRPRYDDQPRYDNPDYDRRPRYDDRPHDDRPRYDDGYDDRPRDPRGPRR